MASAPAPNNNGPLNETSVGVIACCVAGLALLLCAVAFVFMIYLYMNTPTTDTMKEYVGLQLEAYNT